MWRPSRSLTETSHALRRSPPVPAAGRCGPPAPRGPGRPARAVPGRCCVRAPGRCAAGRRVAPAHTTRNGLFRPGLPSRSLIPAGGIGGSQVAGYAHGHHTTTATAATSNSRGIASASGRPRFPTRSPARPSYCGRHETVHARRRAARPAATSDAATPRRTGTPVRPGGPDGSTVRRLGTSMRRALFPFGSRRPLATQRVRSFTMSDSMWPGSRDRTAGSAIASPLNHVARCPGANRP